MNILIAGGTGFIGQTLVSHLLTQNHTITVIGRSTEKIKKIFSEKVVALSWSTLNLEIIKQQVLIINLAGANIGEKRWTPSQKQEIIASRIHPTSRLAEYCAKLGKQAPDLFNASAIGIYGLQKTEAQLPNAKDEFTPINFNEAPDFLAKVARLWESACQPAIKAGVRVINLRFAVVIAQNGGVFKKLALPFYFGLGGPIGSGQQAFCWVSLIDLVRAIDYLIYHKEVNGPVNIVSPNCLQQKTVAKIIGKTLKRPSFIPTPGFILKLIYGQMAEELLLKGQHIKPTVLVNSGFTFAYPDLLPALLVNTATTFR